MTENLASHNPATGEEIWSGKIGDAAAEVAAARAAWPAWAAHSVSFRIEALRRFANVVRTRGAEFAELISKETGKPFWEARTEVGAVVNKVQISIDAYAERTPQRKLEAAMGNKDRGPPQAAWRARRARTVQFPRAPAQRPHRPGADRRQCGRFQTVREDAGDRRIPGPLLSRSQDSGRRRPPADRRAGRRSRACRPARHRRPAVHRLGARRAARSTSSLRKHRRRSSRWSSEATIRWSCGTPKDIEAAAAIVVQSAYLSAGQRCTAARRLIVEDGHERSCLRLSRRCSTG